MNEYDKLVEKLNFKKKVDCILIHESNEELFKQLPEFKVDNVFKADICPLPLREFYKNFVGIYKNIPVIKTDQLKENEVIAIYKGKEMTGETLHVDLNKYNKDLQEMKQSLEYDENGACLYGN